MKKRTACFGWAKKLQWRVKHARDLMDTALKARDAAASKQLREIAKRTMDDVRMQHLTRVRLLRGVV